MNSCNRAVSPCADARTRGRVRQEPKVPTELDPQNLTPGWRCHRRRVAGDLFTQVGGGPALVETDLIEAALSADTMFRSTALTPGLEPTLRRLAELEHTTLALMHGPSFRGDGADQLRVLAAGYAATVAPKNPIHDAGLVLVSDPQL